MNEIRSYAGKRPVRKVAGVLRRLRDDERGMSTAEYAVGTVAAVGLGGLLVKLLASEEMRQLLWTVISTFLAAFVG